MNPDSIVWFRSVPAAYSMSSITSHNPNTIDAETKHTIRLHETDTLHKLHQDRYGAVRLYIQGAQIHESCCQYSPLMMTTRLHVVGTTRKIVRD